MKKLAVVLGIAALLIVGGCTDEDPKEGDTTGSITIPEGDSEVVAVNLTEDQQTAIMESFNTSDNYVEAIIANKDVLAANSESMGDVIEAIELFQSVNITMKEAGTPVMSISDIKDIKGAVKRMSKNMTRMTVREGEELAVSDYQAMLKTEIMPKLDQAIVLLEDAVKANETVVLMTAETNGMNVKIEPAHILLVESLVKSTRGYLNYMLGYDFDMLDADTQELNEGFLTVTDRDYINKSKNDIKDGLDEMISAFKAMPESDMFVFDKETYTVTMNSEVTYTNVNNVLSIPKSLKDEVVPVLTQVRNAFDGAATITVNGYSIKLNLSVLFKDSFEIADIMNSMYEMMPAEGDTVDTWNQEPFANYTFEGILPDGLKNVIESSGEGSWDMFIASFFEESEITYYSEYSEIDTLTAIVKKSKKIRNK